MKSLGLCTTLWLFLLCLVVSKCTSAIWTGQTAHQGRIDAALISIPGRSSISSRALLTHTQQPCSSFEPTRSSSSSSSSSKQSGQNGVNDSSSSYRAHTWALWRGADAAPTAPACGGSLGRQHQAPATSTAEYKPSADKSERGKTPGHVERAATAHTRQWSSDDSSSESIRAVGSSVSRHNIASEHVGETSSVGHATPASVGGSIGQDSDAPTSKRSRESILDGLAEASLQHSRSSSSSTAAAVVQSDIHASSSSARSSSDPQGSQLSLPGPTSSNTAADRSSSSTAITPSSGGRDSSSYNSTGAMASRRKLLQAGSPVCPVGCQAGSCVPVGTGAGFRCQSCKNNLVVNRATGLCACPAGRYLGAPESCVDCPRGSYCVGGVYDPAAGEPKAAQCPDSMTTLGQRSTSLRACVNLPGYSYVFNADGSVGAVRCPANTYGFGFRKQRACVPCPTGFTTNGVDGATTPLACGVPPGYYLKAPGQAAPCGQGTYKTSTVPSVLCTACPSGTTTEREGSPSPDACSVLEPGNYARVMEGGAIREAQQCPQKYWCPGGVPLAAFDPGNPLTLNPDDPTIKPCLDGTWTQSLGATSPAQCLTPPGFKTSGGVTEQCPPGFFRADWLQPALATECHACGEGVQLDPSERLTVYDSRTGEASQLAVGTRDGDCFIEAGQGLYYESVDGNFRARNCARGDEYGVSNRTYGRAVVSCRACPLNQITSSDAASYPNSASHYVNNNGAGGFTSEAACVNQDGYGVAMRVSSPCAEGFYNARDTRGPCKQCPTGTTTQGVGVGKTLADCGLMPGFGFWEGAIRPCPPGRYNDAPWTADTTTPCKACPAGTTSSQAQATSQASCDLCAPGHGGLGCGQLCGGVGQPATYQPPGAPLDSSCRPCTVQETGYSFIWQDTNHVYNVTSIAREGANASTDCLADFAQIVDGAWYMAVQGPAGVVSAPASSFSDCLARCSTGCMFATYDYNTGDCSLRMWTQPVFVGPPLLALKAVPSGDLGTNAWSVSGQSASTSQREQQQEQSGKVRAKAIASGLYTYYEDPSGLNIGNVRQAAPGASSFTSLQDCANACDDDSKCAGFNIIITAVVSRRPTTCTLIYGDTTPGTGKRTMIRADLTRLQQPRIM